MNRADSVKRILLLEALAAHAKQLAAVEREQLSAEAHKELENTGTAPTWRLPNVAQVILPVTAERIEVSNPDHLLEWVEYRHPSEAETVTVRRVRLSFVTALTGSILRVDDDVVIDPETGEVVPGMSVRKGGEPGALTIRPERGVKAALATVAADLMNAAQLALPGGVVDGEAIGNPADPFTEHPPLDAPLLSDEEPPFDDPDQLWPDTPVVPS